VTKKEVLELFHETLPRKTFLRVDGTVDHVARSQAWNDFTNALREDKRITLEQYESWSNPF
jgi:hypothetical protein